MNEQLPPADPASRLYSGESGREYHEGKRALSERALPWVMKLRAEKFQRHVRPSDMVVELGVGAGWNLGMLRCARRVGCDVADALAPRLSSLGIEFQPRLEAVPQETADVAICHHALEHLLEPVGGLRQMRRVLKPQGKLLLHVPWERELRYGRFQPGDPNHHLYTWNVQNLGNLLPLVGYKILSIGTRRYGYDRFAGNVAARLGLGEFGFRAIRALLVGLRPLREVELIAWK